MNDNIIPYVPVAPRVQAITTESDLLCHEFFNLIDKIVQSQFLFNHDTSKGHLSINPEHIKDLLVELNDGSTIDVNILEPHLSNLVYPKFIGVKQVNSPIWNGEQVTVWQFRLDQIKNSEKDDILGDAVDYVNEAMALVRIWRRSVECQRNDPQIEYYANDLSNMLLCVEEKLQKAQSML